MSTTVDADAGDLEPSLQSIISQKSLRWIFVGGKGGVGKTTTSCSLAIQLAKVRKSVLLISTDPAHNLSDAFSQKFGKEARLIDGFTNLSAMEIDPNGSIQDLLKEGGEGAEQAMQEMGGIGSMMQDLAFSIPGVDEAMSFAEVLKQVKSLSYEVIIFDTAPTGHTLRFLQFPTVMEKALAKLSQLSTQFGPMLNSVIGARGGLPGGQQLDEVLAKMESLRETIGEVNTQFKNADMTTFVCVCIPEFLSLYETERMIQELTSYEIDTHAIVVNQLLFPKKSNDCEQCNARRKMQKKYLEQIEELYDEFNVVKMPLLVEEVRGKEKLERLHHEGGTAAGPYLSAPCLNTQLTSSVTADGLAFDVVSMSRLLGECRGAYIIISSTAPYSPNHWTELLRQRQPISMAATRGNKPFDKSPYSAGLEDLDKVFLLGPYSILEEAKHITSAGSILTHGVSARAVKRLPIDVPT
ncbi:MAG: hypothetical protein Q9184_001028 [Pyrenodesmia sp. 2 TL-2023]